MVGAAGFEPAAPCSQSRCSTRLSYAPTQGNKRFVAVSRTHASGQERNKRTRGQGTPGINPESFRGNVPPFPHSSDSPESRIRRRQKCLSSPTRVRCWVMVSLWRNQPLRPSRHRHSAGTLLAIRHDCPSVRIAGSRTRRANCGIDGRHDRFSRNSRTQRALSFAHLGAVAAALNLAVQLIGSGCFNPGRWRDHTPTVARRRTPRVRDRFRHSLRRSSSRKKTALAPRRPSSRSHTDISNRSDDVWIDELPLTCLRSAPIVFTAAAILM